MPQIIEIIEQAERELDEVRAKSYPLLQRLDVTLPDFTRLISIEAESILTERHQSGYLIDDYVLPVLKHLHTYLTGFNFAGSINKGIMLFGALGVGKSVIMKAYTKVIERLSGRVIQYVSAFNLSRMIVAEGIEYFSKRPLLIDDLGKEEEVIKDYGTTLRPMIELFATRYDNGALNFVTTNYNLMTLKDKYGEQNADRFREIFNFIQMEGKSRRDKGTENFKTE